MPREIVKSISTKLERFIVPGFEEQGLSENAKEISGRPLIFFWKKLSREDRFNLSSLIESKQGVEGYTVTNLGTMAKYIWENCVMEVHNVLLEDGEHEVVKGEAKNRLFNTFGMDKEIAEAIREVQEKSAFSDSEVKN